MWTEGSSASSPFDVQGRDNFMVTAASMPATNTLDWPTAPRVNLAFQVRTSSVESFRPDDEFFRLGEGCVRFSSCCVIRLLKLGLESLFLTTVSRDNTF